MPVVTQRDQEAKAMTGDIDDVLRLADRSAIEGRVRELRAQRDALDREIQKRERFLELLNEWSGTEPNASGENRTVQAVNRERPASSAHERREAVLTALRRRPEADWSMDQIRAAVDEMGVSFEGGTPLKNILFGMMQKGVIERPRIGWYKLPASARENGRVEEQDGLRL
jgi:hypothetical protein